MMLPDRLEASEDRNKELFATAVLRAAREHDVSPGLIGRVLRAEGADIGVTSPKGALGPMQLMPSLIRSYGEDPLEILNDPHKNINLGTMYLREMLDRFRGNESMALAAYNAGPTRLSEILRSHGNFWRQRIPLETRRYLRRAGY